MPVAIVLLYHLLTSIATKVHVLMYMSVHSPILVKSETIINALIL